MIKIFDNIKTKSQAKGMKRFVTTIESVQNLEDTREVMEEMIKEIESLDSRLKDLEK